MDAPSAHVGGGGGGGGGLGGGGGVMTFLELVCFALTAWTVLNFVSVFCEN